jgi:hypothetical protein
MSSASEVSFSNSSWDWSGRVNLTSSTFWNWCWRMMPRTSRPWEPASDRKQGVEADGQFVGVEGFVAVEVGDGDFGGGGEPEVRVFDFEEIGGEFGELARAVEGFGVDQERGEDFGVAVLARVRVEHEVDEGAFEFGAEAGVDSEAGAGDFGGAFEVENAEGRAEVPVGLGGEVELRDLAAFVDFGVAGGGGACGNGFVGEVGDGGEEVVEAGVDLFGLFFQLGDFVADGADFGLLVGGVGAGLFELGDFGGFGVAGGFEGLRFGDGGAALGVEGAEGIGVKGVAAVGETGGNRVQVGAKVR